MGLPYENATSGRNALDEIEKILRGFGCSRFATGTDFDSGEIFIQFEHRGRMIHLKASAKGYATAWLKAHPYGPRIRKTLAEHKARALQIGGVAVCSILRDWIKGQVTAIEIGMMSFEGAFLSHIMLPDGRSVIDAVVEQKMLPAPTQTQ